MLPSDAGTHAVATAADSSKRTVTQFQEVVPMKRFVLCLAASVAVGLSGLAPGLRADEPAKEK